MGYNVVDYEFSAGQDIYEVFSGKITFMGRQLQPEVEYLGAISLLEAKQLTADVKNWSGVVGKTAFRCKDELELGQLEQEVDTGMLLVGKPTSGQNKVWFSPVIDNIY